MYVCVSLRPQSTSVREVNFKVQPRSSQSKCGLSEVMSLRLQVETISSIDKVKALRGLTSQKGPERRFGKSLDYSCGKETSAQNPGLLVLRPRY